VANAKLIHQDMPYDFQFRTRDRMSGGNTYHSLLSPYPPLKEEMLEASISDADGRAIKKEASLVPKRHRHRRSCHHVCVTEAPMEEVKLNTAAKSTHPLRPKKLFRGSLSQQPNKAEEK
jgi:hypothetical protein